MRTAGAGPVFRWVLLLGLLLVGAGGYVSETATEIELVELVVLEEQSDGWCVVAWDDPWAGPREGEYLCDPGRDPSLLGPPARGDGPEGWSTGWIEAEGPNRGDLTSVETWNDRMALSDALLLLGLLPVLVGLVGGGARLVRRERGRGSVGMGPMLPWHTVGKQAGGAVLLIVALFLGLLGHDLFTGIPEDVARHRAYRAAVPCSSAAPYEKGEECLRAVDFQVEDVVTVRHAKGSDDHELTLAGSGGWDGTVRMRGEKPLFHRLERGDRVIGTVWRGEVVAVARGDVRQVTQNEPLYQPQLIAATSVYLGYLAALGVLAGLAHLLRPQRYGSALWCWFVLPLVVTGAGVALAAGAIGAAGDLPASPLALGTAVVLLLQAGPVAVLSHRARRAWG
ncbi:hypothetical protein [Streptomyces cathayae]|uniref:DUF3592 domain-containing protein n=1 Tax=Streptomyces cathayae TaxID=3031124 RepID=A0ABY8K227_9ACTN|nr:hypothetical protein [Streptomyces sp. HUAS 5]WGD40956.1 hypothetical protein PYS65_12770 [Streptomyces sp. HUAS 5]